MGPNMRRNLPGRFVPCYLGEGAWRLSSGNPARVDVFVRGAGPQAAEVLGAPNVRDIAIEWRVDGVLLTVSSTRQPNSVMAKNAIVHEPLPLLYEALPLLSVDAKVRRFWRSIFRLVRIPGGRFLLGVLARRRRRGSP